MSVPSKTENLNLEADGLLDRQNSLSLVYIDYYFGGV